MMTKADRILVVCGLVPALLGLALVSGCEDKRRHQTSEDVTFADVQAPVPDDAPPDDVAKALLNTLKELHAIRNAGLGDPDQKERYDKTMGKILSLAAQEQIHNNVKSKGSALTPKDVTQNAAVRLVAESWASIVAHYVDGFLLDTLSVFGGGGGDHATVNIKAENPKERKLLDEIEALPEIAGAKDDAGKPLVKTGVEYQKLLKSKALAKGFNIPIRAELSIHLRKVEGAWRVTRLKIGPASARTPAATIKVNPPAATP